MRELPREVEGKSQRVSSLVRIARLPARLGRGRPFTFRTGGPAQKKVPPLLASSTSFGAGANRRPKRAS
jgi:hypothetical protein